MEGLCKIELEKPLSVQGLVNWSMEVRKMSVERRADGRDLVCEAPEGSLRVT